MCLASPARLIQVSGIKGLAELQGALLEVNLFLIQDPKPGDWVIIHAGFAIQKLDQQEAEQTLKLIEQLLDGSS